MGSWLSDENSALSQAPRPASAATPVPTQIVSNGEYFAAFAERDPEDGRSAH